MEQMISVKSVSHHFTTDKQEISLFKDLTFNIHTKNTYAITGPSGVGKSSLLLILAGLEQPSAGNVQFISAGQALSNLSLRQVSGFIFQQFHLIPELDALNNIALPLKLKGDKEAINKARFWLEKVGLAHREKHKPSQLSGGEQQRVAIARAFVANPSFVFADEPTGNLDEKTANQVADLMFECSRINDTSLIIVTHSKSLAHRADFNFKLQDGHILMPASQGQVA